MAQQLPESPERTKQQASRRETQPASAHSFQPGHHPILQLQRTLGNQRVTQLIRARRLTPEGRILGLQPKLTVGAADDQYEQEADRVARQVVSMPDSAVLASSPQTLPVEGDAGMGHPLQSKPLPLAASITSLVQRQIGAEEESEEDQDREEDKDELLQAKFFNKSAALPLQRQTATEEEEADSIQAKSAGSWSDSFEAGDDVESRINQSKGGGSQLPDSVRAYMEPRFGADFNHVRVHTGSEAIQMNQDVGAQAFTFGSDIYYGAGSSPSNLELTAHELSHVVQQTGTLPLQMKRLNGFFAINFDSTVQKTCVASTVQRFDRDGDGIDDGFRTPEETDQLVRDILHAIARNESGGAEIAMPSRMRTAAGLPASYASSTQMVAPHVVGVLRGERGISDEAREDRREYAQSFGLNQEELRDANQIMLAAQRIWDAIVMMGHNISDLAPSDLDLTGFTIDELTRMFHFGEVRRLLLTQRDRFSTIVAAVKIWLGSEADRVSAQIARLRDGLDVVSAVPSASETIGGSESIITEQEIRDAMGPRALAAMSERRLSRVIPIQTLALPSWWASSHDIPRKRRWLDSRARGVMRGRRSIDSVSEDAASALIASEFTGNEHVIAIGLGESDILAYIHGGDLNRFNEDRQAWNRVALQHNVESQVEPNAEPRTLDAALASAAEAGGGWDLSTLEYESWICQWIMNHSEATDEAVVRAAAAHNGRSSDYPDTIVGHYRRLRSMD